MPDRFGRFGGTAARQVFVGYGGHIDLDIDAIHQRTRNLRHVTLDLRGRTEAFSPEIICEPARAGMRGIFAIQLKALKPKPKGYPKELNTLGDLIRSIRM